MTSLAATLITLNLFVGSSLAATIGFDSGATGTLTSYSEDGFTLTPNSGIFFVSESSGDPAPRLDNSGSFSIVAASDNPFSLTEFQAHESVNGTSTWRVEGFFSGGGSISEEIVFQDRAIEEFRLFPLAGFENLTLATFTALTPAGSSFDNIVVDQVPEPSSAILIGAGFSAIALWRRRAISQ